MSHEVTRMVGVKNPTKCFGEGITRIDDARDMTEDDITIFAPILDGIVTDVNMAGALGRSTSVDHFDR